MRPTLDWIIAFLRPVWFRGKGRLMACLTSPTPGEVRAVVFGARFELDLSDQIQREMYLGVYEPRETRLVRSFLRPGMTFVDAGANVGYFTALAARAVGPAGRVIAIEPSPYAYDRLARMAAANRLDNVETYCLGLSDTDGEAELLVPPWDAGNHAPSFYATPFATPVRIATRTLDRCAEDWALDHIDLLKMDIEGAEIQAVKGATRLLAEGRVGALLCEFNDYWLRRAGGSPASLLTLLSAAGFRTEQSPTQFRAGGVVTLFLRR